MFLIVPVFSNFGSIDPTLTKKKKHTVLTNSSCQVFLLAERIVSYKYGVLIRLTYMYTVWSNFSY